MKKFSEGNMARRIRLGMTEFTLTPGREKNEKQPERVHIPPYHRGGHILHQ